MMESEAAIRALTVQTDLELARGYLRQRKLVLALMRMQAAVYGMIASCTTS